MILSVMSWLFWIVGLLLLPLRNATWPMVLLTYGVAGLLSLAIVAVYGFVDPNADRINKRYIVSASIVLLLLIILLLLGG